MKTRTLSLLILAAGCATDELPVGSQSQEARYEGRYRRFESELISSSVDRTCVVASDGRITCWGENWYGQAGNGTTSSKQLPAAASSVTTRMVAVATGNWHTCGLAADGHVECWGDNRYGQLGDGSTTSSMTPVTVSGVEDAVDLAAGNFHTCALSADGAVKCWGRNSSYQLGDGTTTNRPTAITVALSDQLGRPILNDVLDVSAEFDHTCIVQADGDVRCWGSTGGGQLGAASALWPSHTGSLYPVNAVGASAGTQKTCAVDVDGHVWCVGSNWFGDLGNNSTTGSNTPALVLYGASPLADVIQVSAGYRHTCALDKGGAIYCWGDNARGELGNGSTTTSFLTATRVSGQGKAVAVEAGQDFTCALYSQGEVKCWGRNTWGELGNSGADSRTPVLAVTTIDHGILDMDMARDHGCLRQADGVAKCWGTNTDGQLGDGTTTARTSPTQVSGLADVVDVAAGGNHTCAVLADSTVECWGRGTNGQLGDGYNVSRTVPTFPVTGVQNAVAVATGLYHACALADDGLVRCWGYNLSGQLGDGTTTTRTTSVGAGVQDAVAISAGDWHTCARTLTGISCWGRNLNGQLGDGTTTQRNSPTPVTGLVNDTAAVSAGGRHTCALLSDGRVQCWGANDYGQLGDGTTSAKSVPALLALSGVSAIAAGTNHTCALEADGTVHCWGSNAGGQCGTGASGGYYTSPTLASAVTGRAIAISAGDDDTCVLLDDGTLTCF